MKMGHCHRIGVLLGDVRLSKFAYADAERRRVRLVDLTRASVLGTDPESDRTLPASYIPPEALVRDRRDPRAHPTAGDRWALGVALYVLLSGRFPFESRDAEQLHQAMWAGPPPLPDGVSVDARTLCAALLDRSPLFRPDCEQALRHPWFSAPRRASTKRPSDAEEEAEAEAAEAAAAAASEDEGDALVPVFSPKRQCTFAFDA